MNYELADVQAEFRKGRRTRDQIANIRWIMDKAREFCDPMNRSMPGLPIHHQLPEFTQTHVHQEKLMSLRKTSISALLTMPKPLTMWITNCGKF